MGVDLSTTYLGLNLRSPLVASPSPLTRNLDRLLELEDAGIGAAVLPSMFEEQLIAEAEQMEGLFNGSGPGDGFAEATSFFPEPVAFAHGPDAYLSLVSQARERLDVPVIASLNGISPAGWTRYATELQGAGASALELNVYRVAADPELTSADVEDEVVETVRAVRAAVSIPLSVKLGPFFTSLAHLASRLVEAGADGLVLFNRFYQPDLDLESLRATPHLVLSTSDELRLPLRWIGLLAHRLPLSLALTTGVHTGLDAAKGILVGADVTMMTSALLRNGPSYVELVTKELSTWLDEHEYESVTQAKGSAAWSTGPDPTGFERANYMTVLNSWSTRANTR